MNPIRILLAEDNEGDVFLVHEALRAQGATYEIDVAKDGLEVYRYFERYGTDQSVLCPDVFLLDLNLPKADGHELLSNLRVHPLCSRVPVIIVTSSDAPKDRHKADLLGVTVYFRKPSTLAEFLTLGEIIMHVVKDKPALD